MSFQFLRAVYGEFTHQINCASVVWPLKADTSNDFSYIIKSKPRLSGMGAVTERFQFCQSCAWTCIIWKDGCNSCAVELWHWSCSPVGRVVRNCGAEEIKVWWQFFTHASLSWQLSHELSSFLWGNRWFLAIGEMGLCQLQGRGTFPVLFLPPGLQLC